MGESHTLRNSDSLHGVVERTAASGPCELAFHGCDNRSESGHCSRIFLAADRNWQTAIRSRTLCFGESSRTLIQFSFSFRREPVELLNIWSFRLAAVLDLNHRP